MTINELECKKAGINIKAVKSIASRISKAAKEAKDIGIIVFGGSGLGTLRYDDDLGNTRNRKLVLAYLDGEYDGGDGAVYKDDQGLERGE